MISTELSPREHGRLLRSSNRATSEASDQRTTGWRTVARTGIATRTGIMRRAQRAQAKASERGRAPTGAAASPGHRDPDLDLRRQRTGGTVGSPTPRSRRLRSDFDPWWTKIQTSIQTNPRTMNDATPWDGCSPRRPSWLNAWRSRPTWVNEVLDSVLAAWRPPSTSGSNCLTPSPNTTGTSAPLALPQASGARPPPCHLHLPRPAKQPSAPRKARDAACHG